MPLRKLPLRRLVVATALTLAATLLHGGSPPPAKCAVCFTGTCYNSAMCFRGCFCMKRGMDLEGSCFSSGYAPPGWVPAE